MLSASCLAVMPCLALIYRPSGIISLFFLNMFHAWYFYHSNTEVPNIKIGVLLAMLFYRAVQRVSPYGMLGSC